MTVAALYDTRAREGRLAPDPAQRAILPHLDRLRDGLLNPPGDGGRARFVAFRHPQAALWHSLLKDAGVVTDVRGHVLRVGLGLYHDRDDVERFCTVCRDVLGD